MDPRKYQEAFLQLPANEQKVLKKLHENEARREFKFVEALRLSVKQNVRHVSADDFLNAGGNLKINPLFFTPVENLKLDIRMRNIFVREKIQFLGELVQMSEWEVSKIYGLGVKGVAIIKDILSQLGLSFGMEVKNWISAENRILSLRVTSLYISESLKDCLLNNNILYVGELIQLSEEDLVRMGISKYDIRSLQSVIYRKGLKLDIKLENWRASN